MNKRLRIGPIGTAILGTIALTGFVVGVAMLPGIAHIVGPFIKKKKRNTPIQMRHVEKNINSLVSHGLIKVTYSKNGERVLSLTPKGKFEALLRHGVYTQQKKKWDKVWRVVIFDVPNTKSKTRIELRKAIRQYGFKVLQKSVWVYPYECDDFIAVLKGHLEVSQDVLYMKVQYIENQKHLEKEFGL